jgi:hypothetical protein
MGATLDAARNARRALAAEVSGRPGVSLVDVSSDVDGYVVRVHLAPDADIALPAAVDGVPVTVVRATYGLQ